MWRVLCLLAGWRSVIAVGVITVIVAGASVVPVGRGRHPWRT